MVQELREEPAGVWVSAEATPGAEKAQIYQSHPFYNSVKIQIQNEADKAKKINVFNPKSPLKQTQPLW